MQYRIEGEKGSIYTRTVQQHISTHTSLRKVRYSNIKANGQPCDKSSLLTVFQCCFSMNLPCLAVAMPVPPYTWSTFQVRMPPAGHSPTSPPRASPAACRGWRAGRRDPRRGRCSSWRSWRSPAGRITENTWKYWNRRRATTDEKKCFSDTWSNDLSWYHVILQYIASRKVPQRSSPFSHASSPGWSWKFTAMLFQPGAARRSAHWRCF